MRFADRFGLSMGPLVLRVMLAATFIWAGLGKMLTTFEVSSVQAARLAQMGVEVIVNAPSTTPQNPAAPAIELPDPTTPASPPPASDQPTETNTEQPPSPLSEVAWTRTQSASDAQPDDYPNGGTVRKLYTLALLFEAAANPELDDESNLVKPIWPASLVAGKRANYFAWFVTLSEIGLGILLLVGLLTRIAALGIAITMGTAAWLTVIGPAIQAGNPALGFLPNHDPFNIAAWQGFAWQLSLLTAAVAVFFMGSGPIGIDRALFRRRPDLFDIEPQTESSHTKPQPEPEQASEHEQFRSIPGARDDNPPRGPFDRSVEENDPT